MPKDRLTLLCIAGSLRVPSYSFATCQAIRDLAGASAFQVEIADPRELRLPMYEPDFSLDAYAPNHRGIERLVELYRQADAMIWVSPTYHGTVSGVFKNMLDFAELLSGDERPYFQGRPVGLISINDSTTFAAMRDCARELKAWLAPTHIELDGSDFSSDNVLNSLKSQKRVARLIDELQSFVIGQTIQRPTAGGCGRWGKFPSRESALTFDPGYGLFGFGPVSPGAVPPR